VQLVSDDAHMKKQSSTAKPSKSPRQMTKRELEQTSGGAGTIIKGGPIPPPPPIG